MVIRHRMPEHVIRGHMKYLVIDRRERRSENGTVQQYLYLYNTNDHNSIQKKLDTRSLVV